MGPTKHTPQESLRNDVRAVLQAIREPSEAMLEGFGLHAARVRINYQLMIDAALDEDEFIAIPRMTD